MKRLVAGGRGLGAEFARAIGADYLPDDVLTDPVAVDRAVAGREAVVFFAPVPLCDADSSAVLWGITAPYQVARACADAAVRRLVVVSTLMTLSRYPSNWRVGLDWRTRPTPNPDQLVPHLAERSVREAIRESGVQAVVIRLPELDASIDLAAIVEEALTEDLGHTFWHIRHAGARPAAPAADGPWRDVLAPPEPIPSRPIRNVVLFGAGGPIPAALFQQLKDRYVVRLTDHRPLADIRAAGHPHQPKGAPLPSVPDPPHTEMHCDVTDPDQVLAACEGMDAIINCSVIRYSDRDFAVNALGCYHIARAAVRHRIRRVVQTGPQLSSLDSRVGYHADEEVCGNPPMRPGRNLYGHTKYLGQETLRVFAEWYDLEVPVVLFNSFLTAESRGNGNFHITFPEAADAIARALAVERLPSCYEVITVNTDLPQGRFSPQRAYELLGWRTQDFLEDTWRDG